MSMVIGFGTITLRLHGVNSLKEKRRIVKRVVNRIRNHFNASAAEVGENDIYRKAVIGFSLVGNAAGFINSKMDKVVNMVDEMGVAEIADMEMEIITL